MRNLPVSLARTLPGNRVEPKRAGITAITFNLSNLQVNYLLQKTRGKNSGKEIAAVLMRTFQIQLGSYNKIYPDPCQWLC